MSKLGLLCDSEGIILLSARQSFAKGNCCQILSEESYLLSLQGLQI